MPMVRIWIPLYLPGWLHGALRRAKRAYLSSGETGLNLCGDREVEWSFVAAHLPPGPGDALDFGSGGSYLSLMAARRGFRVVALDVEPQSFSWRHTNVQFVQGDLLAGALPSRPFDLVINCSAVEHVGLAGRYSVTQAREDGDLEAMNQLSRVMTPKGVMLVTVPVGRDAICPPFHRVYGEQRLPRLLKNYAVNHEEFWVKDNGNHWVPCDRATALRFESSGGSADTLKNVYALGCFVLQRK